MVYYIIEGEILMLIQICWCGEQFKTDNKFQEYCSPKCRRKDSNDPHFHKYIFIKPPQKTIFDCVTMQSRNKERFQYGLELNL